MDNFFATAVSVILAVAVSACSDSNDNPVNPNPQPADGIPPVVKNLPGYEAWDSPVDYSKAENWAALPTKADKAYDVFYLQPTSWSVAEGETCRVASLDNQTMRYGGIICSAIHAQAVFGDYCNVYCPYYRQVDAEYIGEVSWEEAQELWQYEASKDPMQALDYYFEHYNQGRPFFLAGHSQGSAVTKALLAGYFKEHPDYLSRMIAAYPLGYAITTNYLQKNPHLKFAEGADDTGVIVSWNVEGAENKTQRNIVVAPSGSLSINPLNWKLDATPASITENKGSLLVTDLVDFVNEIQTKGTDAAIAAHMTEGLSDAAIDTERGVVVTTADAAYRHANTGIFGTASYHSFDWLFFIGNLRENVGTRIASYEQKPVARIMAHRGASAYAPENTLSAFHAAYDLGADGFETDIHITKDNQLVVAHNYSIDGNSNGTGYIQDLTLEELRQYDYGSWFDAKFTGEPIATLDECLAKAKELGLFANLEMKAPLHPVTDYVRLIADAIDRSGIDKSRVMVSAFNHSMLKEMKQRQPDIRVGALMLPQLFYLLVDFDGIIIDHTKPLADLTVTDLNMPANKEDFMLFGIAGATPEDVILEILRQWAGTFNGANWSEVSLQFQLQADAAKYVDRLGFQLDYLHPEWHSLQLDPQLCAKMHTRGIGVNVWTPNDETDLKAVLQYNIDGIITDVPDVALKLQNENKIPQKQKVK